ncbi:hypothetical protein HZS_6768 [Henneguya salminicola]|nr:hypothetical protein HZS_6768 [Henneguya salminicola]
MTDDIDVEALLDEAYSKKSSHRRRPIQDDRQMQKNRRSKSRSRSPERKRNRRSSRFYIFIQLKRERDRKSPIKRSSRDREQRGRPARNQRTPSPPSNRIPVDELDPLTVEERDARTVFMRDLAREVRPRDIENFFRPVGKIRDVRMITDRNSHRPKGIAYVEFANIDSVSQAIRMSGERLLSKSVMIQATMAEKNRAAMEAAALAKQYGPTKLYVGGLHSDITEPMLRAIFEPFGRIDFIQLQYDSASGHSKGFGFVHFKDSEHARHAAEKLNGFELAGKPMKVCHVNEKADFNFVVQDDGVRRSGVRPVTSGSSGAVTSSTSTSARPEPPSSCVQISNVFDSFRETSCGWVKEVEKDITKQVSHYGTLQHIYVDKNSVEGNVFMKFTRPDDALTVVNRLKGRMYSGRVIRAVVFPQITYQIMFPNS